MSKNRPQVKNRFLELLAIKSREAGRRISRAEIAQETGVSISSIQNWAYNKITRFDGDQIAAFCQYFGCTVDELIIVGDDELESPSQYARIIGVPA